MSKLGDNEKLVVQVRASTSEVDINKIGNDLKAISKILESKKIPQIAISVNKGKTEKLLRQQLNEIVKELKVKALSLDNVKLNLNTNSAITQTTSAMKEVSKIVDATVSSIPKINMNLINASGIADIEEAKKKIKEVIDLQTKFKGFSIAKTTTTATYDEKGEDTKSRNVSMQLYNQSLSKAIELKFLYNSASKEILQTGQKEIQDQKKLIALQEQFQNKLAKQNTQISKKGIATEQIATTYSLNKTGAIADENRLKIVSESLSKIEFQRNKMAQISANLELIPSNEFDKLDELIAKFKLVVKEQQSLEISANKLAKQNMQVLPQEKQKAISNVATETAKLKSEKLINKEDIIEINSFKKAMQEATNPNELREVTNSWKIYIEEIKRARFEIEKFKNAETARQTGRTLIPIDRSKGVQPVLERAKKEYTEKYQGAEVKVTASTDMHKTSMYADDLTVSIKRSNGELEKFNLELVKVGKSYQYMQSAQAKVTSSNVSDVNKKKQDLKSYQKMMNDVVLGSNVDVMLKKYESSISLLAKSTQDKLKPLINTARNAKEQLDSIYSQFGGDFTSLSKDENSLRKYTDAIKQYETATKELSTQTSLADKLQKDEGKLGNTQKSLQDLLNTLSKYERTNTNISKDKGLVEWLRKIREETQRLLSANPDEQMGKYANLNKEFSSFKGAVESKELTGQNFFTRLTSQVEKLGIYMSGALIIMRGWQKLTEAVSNVVALDNALNSLQLVTDMSNEKMQELLVTYQDFASELSTTTSQVLAGSEIWLRQGRSIAETNELIRTSTVFSKVAFIDAATSSDLLTSSINGYGLAAKDAMNIVDMMASIDMAAATSSQELAEAMQKTAASAKLAGVPMSDLLGYIATVSETSRQSADTIGTAFKTMFARIQQVKLGKLTDEEGEDVSNVEAVLKSYGITLRDVSGNFRDANIVLQELSEKWKTLESTQKSELGTTLAGLRQREQFTILMDNFSRATELTTIALNSEGVALRKFGTYQESAAAKLEEFSNQWEILSENMVDSTILKTTIELGTNLLALANVFDGFPIKVTATIAGIWALKSAFDAFKGTSLGINLGNNLTQSIDYLKQLKNSYSTLLATQIQHQAMQAGLTVGTNTLSLSQLGLAGSIKAVGTSLLGVIPMWGWVAIAGGAIYGLVKIFDTLNVTAKEQEEIIYNLNQEYNDASDSIDKINAKLKENKETLVEINQNSLDIVDKNTIKALELENFELLKQLEIEKQILEVKKEALGITAQGLFTDKNQYKQTGNLNNEPERITISVATQEQIEITKKLTEEMNALDVSDKNYIARKNELGQALEENNVALSENISFINENKKNLNASDPEQKKLIDNLNKIEDAYIALQTLSPELDTFDEILSVKATSEQAKVFRDIAKNITFTASGKLTKEGVIAAKTLEKELGVINIMFESIGLNIEDVIKKLQRVSNNPITKSEVKDAISAVQLTKELENKALKDQKFLDAEIDYNEKKLEINKKYDELARKSALETFKKTIDDRKRLLDSYENTNDILSLKITLADETDYETKIGALSSQFKNANDYGESLRQEFERLATTTPKTADEAQYLASRITEVGSSIRSNLSSVIEFNKQLTEMQIGAITQGAKDKAQDLSLQIKILDRNMSLLQKGNIFDEGLFAFDYLLPKISQSELDRVKSENQKIIDEQTRHQERISSVVKKATDLQMVENIKAREEERINLNKSLTQLEEDWDKTYKELTADVRSFVEENRELLTKFLTEEEFNKIFENGKNLGENLMDGIADGIKSAKDNIKIALKETLMNQMDAGNANGSLSGTEGSGTEGGQSLSKFFGGVVTSGYGKRGSENHVGIDYAVAKGTPIKSVSNGEIIANGYDGSRGNTVKVLDKYGYVHYYQHLSNPSSLKIGDEVTAGSVIGSSGNTGKVSGKNGGYHLHYEIKDANKRPVNPNEWSTIISNLKPRASGGIVGNGEITLIGDEEIGKIKPELAIYPNGKIKVVGSDGAQIEKFPKGTQIIPHEESKQLLKNIPRYANGGTVGGDNYAQTQADFLKKKKGLYSEVLAYISMPVQDLKVKADIIERINNALYESGKATSGLRVESLQAAYDLELSTAEKLFEESARTTLTQERRVALSSELEQSLDRMIQYETQLGDIVNQTVQLELSRVERNLAYQKDDISNQDEVIKRMERKSELAKSTDEQLLASQTMEKAYNLKAESLQTSILSIQKEIFALQKENAQYVGNFNTDSWFQINGELTQRYRDDLNFVNESEKKKVEIFANTVSKLKQMSNSYANTLEDTILSMTRALEAESNKIANMLDLELRALQAYADKEISRIDDIIKGLEKEKDALNAVNEEKQDALELMKLEEALAKAKTQRIKIYSEEAGGFIYDKDAEAINRAQEDLNAYKQQKAHEEELKRIDEKIEGWNEQKQQYSDLVTNQKAKQDKMLLEMQLGTTLEKFWEDKRINNFDSFAKAYNNSMDKLIEAQIEANKRMQELIDDLDRMKQEAKDAQEAIENANKPPSNTGSNVGNVIGGIIGGIGNVIGGIISGITGKPKPKYAQGTAYNPATQLSLVGEKGAEFRVLNRGDGIIPTNLTKNLMDWGAFTPNSFATDLKKLSSTGGGGTVINQFDKLVLPNVTDGSSFLKELEGLKNFKNLAIQA